MRWYSARITKQFNFITRIDFSEFNDPTGGIINKFTDKGFEVEGYQSLNAFKDGFRTFALKVQEATPFL